MFSMREISLFLFVLSYGTEVNLALVYQQLLMPLSFFSQCCAEQHWTIPGYSHTFLAASFQISEKFNNCVVSSVVHVNVIYGIYLVIAKRLHNTERLTSSDKRYRLLQVIIDVLLRPLPTPTEGDRTQ